MALQTPLRVAAAGLAGGFLGNVVLGIAFSTPWVRSLLYDPSVQSPLFIEITTQRNIPVSVAGLVVLSVTHGWLFHVLQSAIPGTSWLGKGAFWGMAIWLLYWVFQEWFIYYTLLGEPWFLTVLELAILLIGSLVEGLTIARMLCTPTASARR
jgi:hypothetical protein